VSGEDWIGYHDAQGDRPPRDLLLRALASFEQERRTGTAVDLGCGTGADTSPTDLVFASFSLPFCRPDAFPTLWERLRSCLRPGGRFVGELFGDRDSWASDPEMTFHDIDAAKTLFHGLEVETFEEEEEDGDAFDGPKHWHVFHVIARRPEAR
jgi:hypothetical protein